MLRLCSLVFRACYASDSELRLILRANWIHEHLQLLSSHFASKLCCIGYYYSLHCPLKLTELCWYYFDGFLICWLAGGLVLTVAVCHRLQAYSGYPHFDTRRVHSGWSLEEKRSYIGWDPYHLIHGDAEDIVDGGYQIWATCERNQLLS